MNPYEMSNHDCEHHLIEGGSFAAQGGALEVFYAEKSGRGRYVLVNDTGNGGEYVQSSFAGMQHLMEQLTGGSLEAWASQSEQPAPE